MITSFDIGIRNLAYCTLEYCPQNVIGNQFVIHDWRVLDLLKVSDEVKFHDKVKTCHMSYVSGSKKDQPCNRTSHYLVDGHGVCKMHSGSFPKEKLQRYYTTTNTSFFELAKRAVTELDSCDFGCSQKIIFESQPSKNPKMKNFSMMLFNYFIIRYIAEKPETSQQLQDIQFVSSRNKLSVYDGPAIECKLKGQHARNKFYGIEYCKYLLRNNPSWLEYLSHFKKIDDLCDSFLQGAWYLLNNYRGDTLRSSLSEKLDTTTDDAAISSVPKIKLKLKHGPIGRDLLSSATMSPGTIQIRHDTYRN